MRVNDKYIVGGYYPTIGIECHVQLKTISKLFGTESNEARNAKPNTLIGHVTYGLPGALPVLNEEAVRLASKAAYALGTKPQKFSKFDRKHYFYPDLPNGYQITQFDEPIILGGSITIVLDSGEEKIINITRAHIEADAGKSTHPSGVDYSLVDLNRAGTPLLEIVSEPEMHSSSEAKAYAKELWLRMKYADVSDVDLYHGNMRFDVNVSVSKDSEVMGTRSETKNLNSFKSVERAVDYEIKRQIELLEKGGEVVQETRGWLDDKQKTVSQRSKEDAHDYRYFPDPDIPPIVLDDDYIAEIEKDLPIMPDEWRVRLKSLSVEKQMIETLLESSVDLDDGIMEIFKDFDPNARYRNEAVKMAQSVAAWMINFEVPFLRKRKETGLGTRVDTKYRSELYHQLIILYYEKRKIISNSIKKAIEGLLFDEVIDDVEAWLANNGLIQIDNLSELEKIVDQVISENPKPVEDVKSGEMKAIGFLVGQVMKLSQGKANPAEAQKILKRKIGV